MKKITESDLMKIVNKVLNEQKIRQFNEDEIEFLHFIFERELNPPFREGEWDIRNRAVPYYNRGDEKIALLYSSNDSLMILDPFLENIHYKIHQVFELNRLDWWFGIRPHLKSWMESQLNVEIKKLFDNY